MKHNLKVLLYIIFFSLFLITNCFSQTFDMIPEIYRSKVEKALQKAGQNRVELEAFLNNCNNEEIIGASFLLSYMPERDLKTLKASFLEENVKYAYLARKATTWGMKIPDSLFLNYVLPYASIHERRDNWRKNFYKKFIGLVKESKTPGEAAIILNKNIWNIVNVHYSTKRAKADQSPYESMESGLASCTGLAILFVDACRSVGIPARLTGIPMWYDDIGNHTWTEIWDNGWHFVESETSDTLDNAWFKDRASRADNRRGWKYGIYAVSYKKTGLPYHDIFDSTATYLSAVDVTQHYARLKENTNEKINLNIVVKEKASGKRIVVKVQLTERDSLVGEGFTRDESKDLNDMLNFKVEQNQNYILVIKYQGKTIKKKINTDFDKNKTIEILI